MEPQVENARPKPSRALGWSLCGAALALALLAYLEQGSIGFPDGFRSDWDRTRKLLLSAFAGLSLLACLWFALSGRIAAQRKSGAPLRATAIVYLVVVMIVFVVDRYLIRMSGVGG